MFKQRYSIPTPKSLTCPQCGSNRFRFSYSKVECFNCGWSEKIPTNKFGASKKEFNGRKYDSGYEADVAASLELRKKAKDILDYDTQFKVEMWAYRANGLKAFKMTHKVDFRVHNNDGSFELLEAKGIETADYKMRRRFLEELWLPDHPDYTYVVVKQSKFR